MAGDAVSMKGVAFTGEKLENKIIEFTRTPTDTDIVFNVEACGLCHTDLHVALNDHGITQFPVVPGHEAVGTVSWVGKDVTKFKQGDKVGVGYLYDSCLNCSECKRGNEQFCCGGKSMHNGLPDFTCTCGGVSRWGHTAGVPEGSTVHGGFSTKLVVNQHFGIKLPSDIDLVKAAPLLCAGATMYDPIAANNVGKDTKIGIVGMGGLGSFGVKIAKAKGAHVTAITTSPEKEEMCKKIGADNVVWSKEQMSSPENARSLDIILDTVSAKHSADPNIQELLKFKGTYVVIGIPPEGLQVDSNFLVFGGKNLCGSLIGSVKSHEECVKFCHENNIYAEAKKIGVNDVKKVFEELLEKNTSLTRYVLDTSTIQ